MFVRVFWCKDCGDIRCLEVYLYCFRNCIKDGGRSNWCVLMLTLLTAWAQLTWNKLD